MYLSTKNLEISSCSWCKFLLLILIWTSVFSQGLHLRCLVKIKIKPLLLLFFFFRSQWWWRVPKESSYFIRLCRRTWKWIEFWTQSTHHWWWVFILNRYIFCLKVYFFQKMSWSLSDPFWYKITLCELRILNFTTFFCALHNFLRTF